MPKANAKKIRWGLSLLLVIVILSLVLTLFNPSRPPAPQTSQAPTVGISSLIVPNGSIALERAESNAQRQQGLSGRSSLLQGTGMIFVFEKPSQQCFWMKDMNFAIDMVWVDAGKHVVQVKSNVSPSTYPESFCAPNTQYVIELPAGEAERSAITVGRQLQF